MDFKTRPCYPPGMKRRKRNSPSILERFESTCGWCGRTIPAGTPVYGGSGKFRSGVDLSHKAGQVIEVYVAVLDKTILIGVAGLDSEARRDGHDFVYMTCSEDCGHRLREALQLEIDLGNRLASSE